jgi:hypothetical protein
LLDRNKDWAHEVFLAEGNLNGKDFGQVTNWWENHRQRTTLAREEAGVETPFTASRKNLMQTQRRNTREPEQMAVMKINREKQVHESRSMARTTGA